MRIFISSIYRNPPSLFSRMQIDSALEDDFTIHNASYKHVLNAIRPVKPEDFNEASLVNDTFYRFTSHTPHTAGETVVNSLTTDAKAVVDVPHIIMFSDKLDSIWSTLKAMKPLSEAERTQAAIDCITFYKQNTDHKKQSIMDFINKNALECTQSNINDFITILDKKLIAADAFALSNIHTMVKMQGTLGTIISHYSLLQIVGPAVFIASYHIIKNSTSFEFVIKGCLYNQQAALNFKQWNCMFSFLSDEVKDSVLAVSEIGNELTPDEAYWYYR